MILSMKTLKRTIIGLASLAVLFTACNDFEEINKDPNAVDESAIKVSYLLNKSIMGGTAEPAYRRACVRVSMEKCGSF